MAQLTPGISGSVQSSARRVRSRNDFQAGGPLQGRGERGGPPRCRSPCDDCKRPGWGCSSFGGRLEPPPVLISQHATGPATSPAARPGSTGPPARISVGILKRTLSGRRESGKRPGPTPPHKVVRSGLGRVGRPAINLSRHPTRLGRPDFSRNRNAVTWATSRRPATANTRGTSGPYWT